MRRRRTRIIQEERDLERPVAGRADNISRFGITPLSGPYLEFVTTDSTLTGQGTVADPLSCPGVDGGTY